MWLDSTTSDLQLTSDYADRMRTARFADIHCSISRASAVVADPWSLLVLRDLFLGLSTYEQLHRDLGIATNVLADRLDRLEAEGVIERRPYSERPPRDAYHLTASGRDLYGVILTLMAWGDRHRAPEGAPLRLTHGDHAASPRVTCDACGEELTADSVTVHGGPGGRHARGTAVIAELLAR